MSRRRLKRSKKTGLRRRDERYYRISVKFDGTRVKVVKENGQVTLINRHRIIYTSRLPELVEAAKAIKGDFILDGEVVWINPVTGQTEFTPSQRRCSTQDWAKIYLLQKRYPVTLEVFDIMKLNGEDLTKRRYLERKEILADLLAGTPPTFQYVEHSFDLEKKWEEEVVKRGEEGLILKDVNAPYEYERSYKWLKIKYWKPPEVCDVVGYTPGKNARSSFFGSLVLAQNGKFRGCVGSGFNDWELRQIKDLFVDAKKVAKPFDIGEDYVAVGVNLKVEVKYYKHTDKGIMRFPIFCKIVA